MKVIAFNASPRKGANTATLVQAVLKGAESKGAETRLVNLCALNMKGCQGCEGCKKNGGHCVQKDDLSPLLEEMKTYDAIVLGTPIYWFQASSQMKALVDRFYCFLGHERDPQTGELKYTYEFPEGKKIAVVTSRGDEEDTKIFPELYGHLDEWFNVIGMALLASSIQFVHHYGSANEKDAARKDADLLAKAEAIGASLV